MNIVKPVSKTCRLLSLGTHEEFQVLKAEAETFLALGKKANFEPEVGVRVREMEAVAAGCDFTVNSGNLRGPYVTPAPVPTENSILLKKRKQQARGNEIG